MLIEVFVFGTLDLGFEIYDTYRRNQPIREMLYIVLFLIVIQIVLIGVYFICKHYKHVAMYFNAIATVIVTVGIIERNILDGRTIDSGDSYISIIALVTSLSIVGSC